MSFRRRGPRKPLGQELNRLDRAERRGRVVPTSGQVLMQGPDGYVPGTVDIDDGYVAWVTTAITAGSGATAPLTLGFGNVSLGRMNTSTGVISNAGPVVKVWNWSVTGFAVGEKVAIHWKYGVLFVHGGDCLV